MTQLKTVAVHYTVRIVVVVTAWTMKRLWARKAWRAADKKTAGKPAAVANKPMMRFIWRPARDYKPNNPRWLIEAASWRPDNIPQQLLPECPALAAFKEGGAAGIAHAEFGSQQCREQLFALDPSFTYLNHGSYGATYRLALDVQTWYRDQMEQEPVRFMETVGVAGLVKAVADVAEFVGASWQDVVPVVNATSAVNAVVNSVQLKRGDLLLMSNTTYPAVRSTLARGAAAAGAGLLDLTLDMQDLLDEQRLVDCFKSALAAAGRRLKLVVLDHVVSFPPVVMPVQQICELCRDAGVPVLVDGAHAVGCLPDLDVPSLGATYYTSNLHKWCCAPKGAALLWVHSSKQDDVRPLLTSHGYGLGFRGEFLWQGTSDPTPWLSVPASLAVMQALQLPRIAAYNHGLVKEAAALLQRAWGTKLAVGIGQDGSTAGMVAVNLPWPLALAGSGSSIGGAGSSGVGDSEACEGLHSEGAASAAGSSKPAAAAVVVAVNGVVIEEEGLRGECAGQQPTPADAAALNKLLRDEYRIEVPVAYVASMLWVRISAQIYNRLGDYQRLVDVVLQLQRKSQQQ